MTIDRAANRFYVNGKRIRRVISIAVLLLFACVILVPFWIMVVTSFKTPAEILSEKFTWWPTDGYDFTSYKNIFDFSLSAYTSNIVKSLGNTLLYVIPTTFVGVLVSGMSAYAFAKINFKGRDKLFAVLLLTMVMPGTVVLIPQFFIYNAVGWYQTPLPLIVPGLFGTAGSVFFLRQYMRGVPNELGEAAAVDGLGKFGFYWRVMLPVCVPAFTAQFVLNFIGGYNDYLGPIMFLGNATKYYTLQVFLKQVVSGYEADIQAMMANALIAVVPLVLVYFCLQNFIIGGISVSAVKG